MARRFEIRNKRHKPIEKQDTDWKLGTWNCRSLNFLGFEFALANELQPRNFDVVALQEVCLEEEQVENWPKDRTNSEFYLSSGKDKKLGTGFIVRGRMRDRLIDFKKINERMCKLRIRGRFFNYSILNVHCPHEEKTDDDKEAFYAKLEEEYDSCPRQDVKVVCSVMTMGPYQLHPWMRPLSFSSPDVGSRIARPPVGSGLERTTVGKSERSPVIEDHR